MAYISIHAPVKGATRMSDLSGYLPLYFNPRTREGCDYTLVHAFVFVLIISIHAPVKGATAAETNNCTCCIRISIHAPMKGATSLLNVSQFFPFSISIHAPVKGATRINQIQ